MYLWTYACYLTHSFGAKAVLMMYSMYVFGTFSPSNLYINYILDSATDFLFGRLLGESIFLKRIQQQGLGLQRFNLNNGQDNLDTWDQNGDANAQHHVLSEAKANTAYQHKYLILTFKHGCGGMTIWDCFTATGSRRLPVIQSTFLPYQRILDSNVRPSSHLTCIKS